MRVNVFLFAFLATLTASGQILKGKSSTKGRPTALFTVNGRGISGDEFKYVYKKNNRQSPENFTEEKLEEYFNLMVNFKLKVEEARQRGLDTTAAFQKEFKTYHDELRTPFLAEADIVETLSKTAYDRLTEEVKASHILIAVKSVAPEDTIAAFEKLSALRQRVVDGEDFTALAKQFSEDPSAKQNGGSLGYFTALQMVFPFEDAAYNLQVGEVSQPVRTRFGYHLIRLEDRRPARGEVEVSHILLRSHAGTADAVKNKAFEIFDQLKAGRDWNEVCNEYSEDQNTKSNGGRLRPFGTGAMSSVPQFEEAAFALTTPGDISDPFQSSFGWHIIRLERKIPLPPYSEMKPALKKKILGDARLQSSKVALLNKRKRALQFQEFAVVKDKIFAFADSSLTKGKWRFAGEENLLAQTLFSLQGNDTDVQALVAFVRKQQRPSSLKPVEYLQQLYESFVEETINNFDEQQLLQNNPEYRYLLNEYREGILFFSVMETEVWNKAAQDEAALKTFYDQNPFGYQAGPRVEARYFGADDRKTRDVLLQKVNRGDSIISEDIKPFKVVRDFELYEKGDVRIIDLVPWAAGVHVAEDKDMFYLVEITRLVAPGQKTFDEARAQVISEYQQQLEKEWINTLKIKYPVTINKKEKKKVFNELKSDAS